MKKLLISVFTLLFSMVVLSQEQVVSTRGKAKSGAVNVSIEQLKEQKLDVKTKFNLAQKLYRSRIANVWPKILTSSSTRWVSYSEDWLIRRQVDYKKSKIELSIQHAKLDDLDVEGLGMHTALRAHAEKQLDQILRMTVVEAFAQDPALAELIGSDASGEALLMGALFDSVKPSDRMIERVKSSLLSKAYVQYPTVASSVPSVNLGTLSTDFIIPLPRKFRGLPSWLIKEFKASGLSSKGDQQVMQAISYASTRNNMASADGERFGLLGLSLDSVMAVQPELLLEDNVFSYLLDPRDNMSIGVRYYLWLLNEFGGVRKSSKRRFIVAMAFYLGKDRLLNTLDAQDIGSLNKYSIKSLYSELMGSGQLTGKEQAYLADLVDYRKKQVMGA
ncbi:hypothetical protein [Litoribacillus peritrichatus]